jgi:hypothetical protein
MAARSTLAARTRRWYKRVVAATHSAKEDAAPAAPVAAKAAPGAAPHELLALQRSIGNAAVGRLLARQVRVDKGAKRVDEAYYTTGAGKSIGSRYSVAALISDGVKRVFESAAELEEYANGKTDYIGDVKTKTKGTFWFRVPKDKLTVLGELHHDEDGNFEDVVRAFRTSRFMYEPFNEFAATTALPIPFSGTQARLEQVNKGIGIAGFADRAKFDPDLENIVIKALTGASILRNEFIPGKPLPREDPQWKKRPDKDHYSYGERVALYFSFAIHIAQDVAKHDFGRDNYVESLYVKAGRHLKESYLSYQAELDAFAKAKDADDLIAIYDLSSPGGYANLTALEAFSKAFHEYGSRYIGQLGDQLSDKTLIDQGEALAKNLGATIDDLGPAREAIMWQKIVAAKGYLLVGMGDAHHVALTKKLDAAKIPHNFVPQALVEQRDEIDKNWK